MNAKRLAVGAAVAGVDAAGHGRHRRCPGGRRGRPATTAATADHAIQSGNLLWIVIGAALVIFMQAGFALVETGFCRAKHAAHVVSTNLAIFGLGFVGFFLVGFPFMFGGYSYVLPGYDYGLDKADRQRPLIGSGDWVFLWKGGWAGTWFDGGNLAYTGAVAGLLPLHGGLHGHRGHDPDRVHGRAVEVQVVRRLGPLLRRHLLPAVRCLDLGRRLARQARQLHGAGATATSTSPAPASCTPSVVSPALAGAIVLGPRIGKFDKDGKPRALPGHHIPMAMLGTFILLFGWFGFNAASTFAVERSADRRRRGQHRHRRCLRSVVAMFWIWIRTGKPDPAMMANGMLAGLVVITAPCAFVDPWVAMVLGIIAGVVVIEAVFFIERKLKIDDPVGAISVHGVCGTLGVLAVGIFANGKYGIDAGGAGIGWNGTTTSVDATASPKGVTGLFYGGNGGGQLLSQLTGHRHHLDRDLRHRLRLLQDPERRHQGRHPVATTTRRSPASTCRRWASSPTRSSPEPTRAWPAPRPRTVDRPALAPPAPARWSTCSTGPAPRTPCRACGFRSADERPGRRSLVARPL